MIFFTYCVTLRTWVTALADFILALTVFRMNMSSLALLLRAALRGSGLVARALRADLFAISLFIWNYIFGSLKDSAERVISHR